MNRNRTFISDDFAQQLINSLPYAPVKGIYDEELEDFTSHGKESSEGKIYGIVMAEPNVKWEDHVDEDGVTRTYCCADVLLFTGIYDEATKVCGSSQSMEIYDKTMIGEWRKDDKGEPFFYFMKGCLLGLQALGEMTEPCFEGSAFYELYNNTKEIVEYVRQFSKKEAVEKMEHNLFRLSDSEKYEAILVALNPDFTAEKGWKQDYLVCDVYDEYAIAYNFNTNSYVRAYYTKESDTITLGDIVDVSIVDVTKDELIALEAIKATSGSFAQAKEDHDNLVSEFENLKSQVDKESTEHADLISSLEGQVSEFKADKAIIENQLNEALERNTNFSQEIESLKTEKLEFETRISDLENENTMLNNFKKAVEMEKKEQLLTKYEQYIDPTKYEQLRGKIEDFTVDDFKKEVCTAAVESATGDLLDKENGKQQLFYTQSGQTDDDNDDSTDNGVIRILKSYKKNGGNK